MSAKQSRSNTVTIGSLIALAFACVFFSGLLQTNEWYGVFDFTTLNGSFGKVVASISEGAEGVTTAMSDFRGRGGSGAKDGFLFALTLVPTVMFAMGMIEVLQHFGALEAARRLMTPLLRPLMGISGDSGLALIASLQSTDAGSSMTRGLIEEGQMTKEEGDVFTMFQFSAGAMIVNFFSSGAVLFTLMAADGTPAVPASIGLCVAVMFVTKIFGANLMRIYLKMTRSKKEETPKIDENATAGGEA